MNESLFDNEKRLSMEPTAVAARAAINHAARTLKEVRATTTHVQAATDIRLNMISNGVVQLQDEQARELGITQGEN
jgi:hypothetical protein